MDEMQSRPVCSPTRSIGRAGALGFASLWFAALAMGLVIAVIVGEYFVLPHKMGVGGWMVLLVLVAGPYSLVAIAARWANRTGNRLRGVRVCGRIVVGLGCALVFVPLIDVFREEGPVGRPNKPALALVGVYLVAGQWVAAVAALLIERSLYRRVGTHSEVLAPRVGRLELNAPVFVALAWASTVIPLVSSAVVWLRWTAGTMTTLHVSELKEADHRSIGVALMSVSAISLGLAGISFAGIRTRRDAARIVPPAVLGILLGLSCIPGAGLEICCLAPNWSPR